MANYNL